MGNNDHFNDEMITLELVKRDQGAVRRMLPAVAIMASYYYFSLALAGGLAVGYFGSQLFSKFFLEKGKVGRIFIDCGKWKLHLHHWITGAAVLAFLVLVYNVYLTGFVAGIIFGVMAHDIYDYNDWMHVFEPKEKK